jgi:hypothetical protein
VAKTAPFEIERHYRQMSEKDTDAVVQAVAELIVARLRQRGGTTRSQQADGGEVGNGPPAARDAAVREHPVDE